jgi:hypothetical protein
MKERALDLGHDRSAPTVCADRSWRRRASSDTRSLLATPPTDPMGSLLRRTRPVARQSSAAASNEPSDIEHRQRQEKE